jgi:glycosyltransferase involved in cell wall biosynthesis
MMRLLYVNAAAEQGGAEIVLLNILKHLDRRRFQPFVVLLRNGDLERRIREELAVDVLAIPAGRFRNIFKGRGVVRRLRQIIGEQNIDLVHSNGTGAHIYGGLAARSCGVLNVYHLHDVPERSWTRQGLVQWLAGRIPASAHIAVSQCVADKHRASVRNSGELIVIHNGIAGDASAQSRVEEDVRQRHGWSATAPLAVWCGRLQRWKGAHIFLEAVARVRAQLPEARFFVVGGALFGLESEYEPELHRLAQHLGLNDCLRFTGYTPEAQQYVRCADVMVHSSLRADPFPTVLLESMLAGKPVIASAAGGPTELVVPEITGLLVPPQAPDELARAMFRLLTDKTLRDKMGLAARTRVAESFTIDHMMVKLQRLYERLKEAGPAPRQGSFDTPELTPELVTSR